MIPEAAVEAAAEALCRAVWDTTWAMVNESQRYTFRNDARLALEAAAPHMLAGALEEVADALEAAPYETLECYASIRDWPDALNVNHGLQAGTRYLRARAETYRPTP